MLILTQDLFDFTLLTLTLICLAVMFVAYFSALVDAAKSSKWSWFVLMLLISPTCILYYLGEYGSGGPQGPNPPLPRY